MTKLDPDPIGTIRGDKNIQAIKMDREGREPWWLDPVKDGWIDPHLLDLPIIGFVPYTPADEEGAGAKMVAAAIAVAEAASRAQRARHSLLKLNEDTRPGSQEFLALVNANSLVDETIEAYRAATGGA